MSISVTDPLGILLIAGVAISLLFIRLLPRLLAGHAQYLTPMALHTRLNTPTETATILLLDVRMPSELAMHGQLANSLNIPLPILRSCLATDPVLAVAHERPIVVICESGTRAAYAARLLQQAAFSQVYVLQGGFSEWRQDGLPVTLKAT